MLTYLKLHSSFELLVTTGFVYICSQHTISLFLLAIITPTFLWQLHSNLFPDSYVPGFGDAFSSMWEILREQVAIPMISALEAMLSLPRGEIYLSIYLPVHSRLHAKAMASRDIVVGALITMLPLPYSS